MTQRLIIQPAGALDARKHYEDTVLNPVSLDRIRGFINQETAETLLNLYKGHEMPVWGFTPAGSNETKWKRIESGDVALFLRKSVAYASATISFKIQSHDLAAELWGYDENGLTWEYIYFLDEVQNQHIEYVDLNKLLGYSTNNNFQQSLVLDEDKSEPVITQILYLWYLRPRISN
jgi:hypothetical protein